MPDPPVAAFTEALAEPAGIVPAGWVEDYAVELAAIARRVLGDDHDDHDDHLRRLAERANCYVDETMLTEEADRG